jgi:hypothetical protein
LSLLVAVVLELAGALLLSFVSEAVSEDFAFRLPPALLERLSVT